MKKLLLSLAAVAVAASGLVGGAGAAQAAATNVVKVHGYEKEVLVYAAVGADHENFKCYWVGTSVSDDRYFVVRMSPNAPKSCAGFDGYTVYKFRGQEKKAKELWAASSVSCADMAADAASRGVPQGVIADYSYPGGKYDYCYPDLG